jgi:rRNA maturation RNase YbeY
MAAIQFFSEGIQFTVPNPRKTSNWIKSALSNEKARLNQINYIFCSDEYLRELNVQYLRHKTYTDIITFNYGNKKLLEGDIFISIDRIKENAKKFDVAFENELRRVIIHGVLHLIGYNDKSSDQKSLMRKKEDLYLSLWH